VAGRRGPSRLGLRLRGFGWPWSRLSREGRAFSSITFAAGVFGADVGGSQTHVLLLASLSLIAASLLFTFAYRLAGVSAELSFPRRVSVGDELCLSIALENRGVASHRRIRIEPPLLAWDGNYTSPPEEIEELPPGARRTAVARARFSSRGEHQVGPFRALALLPLGLSQGPEVQTGPGKFMVVPRVAKVVSLDTPQNRRHQPGGVSQASRTGDATDLLGIRPYRMGDPLRDLHARAWARHGKPMVREYQEEFFTRIGVVVDTDRSAASHAHVEGALSLAAGILARLCNGEALVDVLVTGDKLDILSFGRSLGSFDRALDLLATAHERTGFDVDVLLARLAPHLVRLSSVVFVALGWDEARARFAATVEARGLRCLAFVVGESSARSPRYRCVSLAAITAGQELAL
jgi:uncharacterized protein (DUF58 family)